MDQVAALSSRSIGAVLMPTFKIFTPLLQAHESSIKAIPPKPYTYGTHPRQKVDVYSPPSTSSAVTHTPILIFLYGGGLSGGEKVLQLTVIYIAYLQIS
jgi:acetyl esterase/lipase